MLIEISKDLTITDAPEELIDEIKEALTLMNPDYINAIKYRGRVGKRIPKYIKMWSGDRKKRLHCHADSASNFTRLPKPQTLNLPTKINGWNSIL